MGEKRDERGSGVTSPQLMFSYPVAFPAGAEPPRGGGGGVHQSVASRRREGSGCPFLLEIVFLSLFCHDEVRGNGEPQPEVAGCV